MPVKFKQLKLGTGLPVYVVHKWIENRINRHKRLENSRLERTVR